MKKTHLIKALFKAFYSRELYVEVLSFWQQRTFFYLIVFLLIFWVPTTLVLTRNFEHFFSHLAAQFPEVTIKHGVATTKKVGPSYLYDHKANKVLAVVDTSDQYKGFSKSTAVLLVGRTGYAYKEGQNNQIKHVGYGKITTVWNQTVIASKIDHLLTKVAIAAYLLGVTISYLACLIWGFLFGIVAFILGRMRKLELPFMGCFGAGVVSLTPGLCLFFVLLWCNIMFGWEWLLVLLIQLAYLTRAVYTFPIVERAAK